MIKNRATKRDEKKLDTDNLSLIRNVLKQEDEILVTTKNFYEPYVRKVKTHANVNKQVR